MATLRVQVTNTAANTDQLAGTDLETTPGPGWLRIWQASSVNTATLTAVVGQGNIARSLAISLRANGLPSIVDDPPVVDMAVAGGERIILNLGGTTGTVYTIAEFTPLEDLD